MSGTVSRVLVALVGLPIVLGAVWAGGWWLFALVTVAGMIAVHEFVTMARPLRPLAPAVYVGTVLALLGAEKGGLPWMLGGFLSCFIVAFALNAVSKTRSPATASVGSTVLGAAWIGFGLAHLILLRRMHDEPRVLAFAVLLTVFAADTFAYFGGRLIGRHKLAPTLSPGKTWEGFLDRLARRHLRRVRRALPGSRPLPRDLAGDRARRSSSCSPPPRATCSSRC